MKERNFFESQTYLEKDCSNLYYWILNYPILFDLKKSTLISTVGKKK